MRVWDSSRVSERGAVVAVGLPADPADVVLTLGPEHPSAHGVLRVRLGLGSGPDADLIVRAEPLVGYVHRGAEKLFEVRDYRQIMVLANRHDWLSAFANELGVALAVERMLGIAVPERATWARVALAELNRVLNHLMFLGATPPELAGGPPVLTAAVRERERLQAVMEEASGGRMHYMLTQVGGLKEDLPAGWVDRARAAVAGVRAGMAPLDALVLHDDVFRGSVRGRGVLTAEQVLAYGVTGPPARAAGVDIDLRRDRPYLGYAELFAPGGPGRVVTRTEGDALARFECLHEQVGVSLDLVDAALDRLDACPPGPINVRLPKVLKAPEGHYYQPTESPLGVNGYYLVSRGERTPWRLKLRTPSFNNVQVLGELLPGHRVGDLVAVLCSLFFVIGDIDK